MRILYTCSSFRVTRDEKACRGTLVSMFLCMIKMTRFGLALLISEGKPIEVAWVVV